MQHRLTFYPIGNADTLYIDLSGRTRVLISDFANMRDPNNQYDARWDIASDIRGKLNDKKARTGDGDVDVFCISHVDDDHICGAADFFYLDHAAKYQASDRPKIKELWVPAGAITEEGCDDQARIWRTEARHRLKAGKGIRVFSRPERLRGWLEANGLTLESRGHLITDAGRVIEGFTKEADSVEFFLHSPHGHRIDARTVEDRNQDSVVMQATFTESGVDTRVMLGGDTTWEPMEDIVRISKAHNNAHRLEFEVFKLPHHCSYLSLSDQKGERKTEPKPLVREWFEMASRRAIVISTSEKIGTADQSQPPHFQAANFHKDNLNRTAVLGQFKVTMEHPTAGSPKPLVLCIDRFGTTIETQSTSGSSSASTTRPTRAGSH